MVKYSVQTTSPFSMDSAMIEDPSPLDVDPMTSPAEECQRVEANPTWFRRLSRDLGPTPIAV